MNNFVTKDNRAEEALTRIQQAIVSGELRPNQRLIEADLSAKYGMSRTPVREAIRRLQHTGYVTVLPNGGAIVTEFSQRHIKEQFEIREVLEELVVKLVCEQATDEQLQEARRLLEQAAEAAEKHDLSTYYKYNADFRDLLLETCGNERLINLVKTLRDHYYLSRLVRIITDAELRRNIKQQFLMIDSMIKRDKAGASRAIKQILRLLSKISMSRMQ